MLIVQAALTALPICAFDATASPEEEKPEISSLTLLLGYFWSGRGYQDSKHQCFSFQARAS
jgi:hypothetical protein